MNICNLDVEVFRAVNGLAGRSEALDAVGVFSASSLIFLMVAAMILLAGYRYVTAHSGKAHREAARDITLMLRAAAASLAAIGGNFLFSLLYFRDRPFAALYDVTLLIGEPMTAKSLPSDHASMAFAIAMSVVLLRPKLGAAFLIAAAAIAASRVYVGVHYPSDALAGMFVGILAAVAVRYLGRRLRDVDVIGRELKSLAEARRKT